MCGRKNCGTNDCELDSWKIVKNGTNDCELGGKTWKCGTNYCELRFINIIISAKIIVYSCKKMLFEFLACHKSAKIYIN